MFFLGIISVIIIRNYLSIFLEEKIMKNQKIFVGICLVCSILLETNSKIPFFNLLINYICLFDYLFISSQMSAKPYFIGSTGILLLW